MKYYGIKSKIKQENLDYALQKNITWLQTFIPGRLQKMRKHHYNSTYKDPYSFQVKYDNSIPAGGECEFYEFVTLDLVRREDIPRLQKGIKALIYRNRSSKFFNFHNDSIEAIYAKIDNMDSSLLEYNSGISCGIFDFEGTNLSEIIRYFTLSVLNVNASFLGIECVVTLSKDSEERINEIIRKDYHDKRGYPQKYLSETDRSVGKRISNGYTAVHYNDAALKADKIYEFISCIEWEFYEALQKNIPVLLHKNGIAPPRIDIFVTNIDYKNCKKVPLSFWDSVGVVADNGQFINENPKIFFRNNLSGRYSSSVDDSRIIYIYRKNTTSKSEYSSIEGEIYSFIHDYAIHIFKYMILNIFAKDAGKYIVEFKTKMDKISIRRNHLKVILKQNYMFEKHIDNYRRYVKDEPWKDSEKFICGLFFENDTLLQSFDRVFLLGNHHNFQYNAISSKVKLDHDLKMVLNDYKRKKEILSSLFDYTNVRFTWLIGVLTLIVACLTLLATLNPDAFLDYFEIFRKLCGFMLLD